jgi:hypothetical protein
MSLITSISVIQKHIPLNVRFYGWVLLFSLFLIPFSIDLRDERVSANYTFILFPIIALMLGQKLQMPTRLIQALIGLYIAIFVTCIIYQYDYIKYWDRRIFSFVSFMSIFIFFFIKIDEEMTKAFKYTIILVSLMYSLTSITQYFYYGGAKIGYGVMLGLVQSQRYGFILLFGFWLVFFEQSKTSFGFILKVFALAIIFNGLGLTFSRSSVAGLLVSSGCVFVILLIKYRIYSFRNIFNKNIFFILFCVLIAGLIISISYHLIPDYFQYFSSRLLKISIMPKREYIFFSDAFYAAYDTNEYFYKDTSEGYRIFMIGKIFNYLINSPLFGSGFLGVWVMFDDLAGAAHNQLLDVMFRTGILGFLGYILLFYKIIKYNFQMKNWAVIASLAGILVIGFFHETFKLSQGAFVFAFLVAQAFSGDRVKEVHASNVT